MGIPICLFAYGTAGLGASAIASVIILHFTLGVLLAKKAFHLEILILKYATLWNNCFSHIFIF